MIQSGGDLMNEEFGQKLKTLREENGMSQSELADELNVSRQAVYKWESNKGYPDIENLIRISDIFDVTIDEMIRKDKALQNKISIDDEKNFEQLSDPGFYIGMILIFLGALVFDGNLGTSLMMIGLISIIFFDDLIKSIKSSQFHNCSF